MVDKKLNFGERRQEIKEMIASEQLDRKSYCIELEPLYCDLILQRYEKLTGKQVVKL